jgi:hypothetical protein
VAYKKLTTYLVNDTVFFPRQMIVTVLGLTGSLFFIQSPEESELRIDREPYLAKVQEFHHLSLWELELS